MNFQNKYRDQVDDEPRKPSFSPYNRRPRFNSSPIKQTTKPHIQWADHIEDVRVYRKSMTSKRLLILNSNARNTCKTAQKKYIKEG
mmetsp:Transcript_20927/g.18561  ORF Transcript_20927/g.18561 Transcript_20927/m.18561 type:complete len:86 (-) Transcript_20927:312-569(-)